MAQILIIDDDPTVQLLLTRALQKSGYGVEIAQDGDEGLKKAEETQPALIICDWLMPKLTGLEVCRFIKNNPALATTFFILVTSRVSIDDRVQGLDAGADDFICKPIDLQELQARIRAGLRLHQLSEDLQQQKRLLETELAEAADYVASVLPEPLIHPDVNIDFRFIPSRQLGGDIFDYFFLDENHLVFYLLDVSGHGLKATLPSISVLNLLRTNSLEGVSYSQPSEILAKLNDIFPMTERNDKYFTIWYGVFSLKQKKLTYSSAGHPPAILVHDDNSNQQKAIRLKAQGIPIGMFPNLTYQNQEYQLNSPARLYLFSDGVYELSDPDGTIWGLDNFEKVLTQPNANLAQIIPAIEKQKVLSSLNDDTSIMEIRFL